jgi:hypothetical protein
MSQALTTSVFNCSVDPSQVAIPLTSLGLTYEQAQSADKFFAAILLLARSVYADNFQIVSSESGHRMVWPAAPTSEVGLTPPSGQPPVVFDRWDIQISSKVLRENIPIFDPTLF